MFHLTNGDGNFAERLLSDSRSSCGNLQPGNKKINKKNLWLVANHLLVIRASEYLLNFSLSVTINQRRCICISAATAPFWVCVCVLDLCSSLNACLHAYKYPVNTNTNQKNVNNQLEESSSQVSGVDSDPQDQCVKPTHSDLPAETYTTQATPNHTRLGGSPAPLIRHLTSKLCKLQPWIFIAGQCSIILHVNI